MNRGLKKNKDSNAVPQVGSARPTHFAGSAACSDTKCGIPSCCRHDVMSGSLPYSGVGTQPNQITIPYHTIPYDTINYHYHYQLLPCHISEMIPRSASLERLSQALLPRVQELGTDYKTHFQVGSNG